MTLTTVPKKTKTPVHASASQVKTHSRCRRKWWFEKCAGIRKPPSTAMKKGTAVHSAAEHRLLKATWDGVQAVVPKEFDPATILEIAMSHHREFPTEPVPKEHVEAPFRIPKGTVGIEHSTALDIIGFIDWIEFILRRVNDHKTLSNSIYMLTHTELERDPQGIIYPKAASISLGMKFPITFRHLYYPTSSRAKPDKVEVQIEEADLNLRFDTLAQRTHIMARDGKVEEAIGVPPNLSACGDYGGCPFRMYCNLVGDMKSYDPFGFAPIVKASNKASTEKKPMGLFNKLQKSNPNPTPVEDSADAETPKVTKKRKKPTAGINPPDENAPPPPKPKKKRKKKKAAPVPPKPPEEEPTQHDPTEIERILKALKEGKEIEDPANNPALTSEERELAWRSMAEERGVNTDDPLSTLTFGQALVAREGGTHVPGTGYFAPGQEVPPGHTPQNAPAPQKSGGGTTILCIGCLPRKAGAIYFDDWIYPFSQVVAKTHNAKHYLLGQNLDYGKGKAEVAVAVKVWMNTPGNKLPTILYVDRKHPLADMMLSELIPLYDEVFDKVM